MNRQEAIAEVFITAFKTLPKKEKGNIAEKIYEEFKSDLFSKDEWHKIEILAMGKGKVYTSGKLAKEHLIEL